MNYQLIIKPSAEKQLHHLPKGVQGRIIEKLAIMRESPRGSGATKLAGSTTTWRVRVGDYRIVYEIYDDKATIFVTIIAHRREVYRGL